MNATNPLQFAEEFSRIAEIAGVFLKEGDLEVEVLPAPHRPPSFLPTGKAAVYVFLYRGQALKVGKVNQNSGSRYTSHHYNPGSAPSTLAGTLLKRSEEISVPELSSNEVGSWIKENAERHNFLLNGSHSKLVLALLESFLQCRYKPVFEGFASQK